MVSMRAARDFPLSYTPLARYHATRSLTP